MKTNVIYYFSGTGNSYYTAYNIAKALGDTSLISMRCSPSEVPSIEAKIVGIVFPVHEWTLPLFVKTFLETVQINKNAYLFCVITCGGIVGNCLTDLEDVLNEKGLELNYCKKHYGVANYVVLYKPFPIPRLAVPVSRLLLKPIIKGVLRQERNKVKRKSTYLNRKLRQIGSKNIPQFPEMDRDFNISVDCIGCGKCSRVCPIANIVMEKGKPLFCHNCTQCMACIAYCPQNAINYKDITQKRNKYRHPDVTINELCSKIIEIE